MAKAKPNYCFNCGREIPRNINHCPYCGANLAAYHRSAPINNRHTQPQSFRTQNRIRMPQERRTNPTKKLIVGLVSMVIVIILLVGGLKAYHKHEYPKDQLPPSITYTTSHFQHGLKLISRPQSFSFVQGGGDAGTGTHMNYHVDSVSYYGSKIYVSCDYTGSTFGSDNGVAHYNDFTFKTKGHKIIEEKPNGGTADYAG